METVLDNVGTAISIAQQNSVQLTRANLRLDVLEDRLARALLYMDTSSSSSSSSNDSSLDDSIRQHDAVSNDIGFMIPCTAEVQLESLDEMLKDTANRQWTVRYHKYIYIGATTMVDNNARPCTPETPRHQAPNGLLS